MSMHKVKYPTGDAVVCMLGNSCLGHGLADDQRDSRLRPQQRVLWHKLWHKWVSGSPVLVHNPRCQQLWHKNHMDVYFCPSCVQTNVFAAALLGNFHFLFILIQVHWLLESSPPVRENMQTPQSLTLTQPWTRLAVERASV